VAFDAETAFGLLARAREEGRLAHAYLIAGPEGCGKRRLADRLAAAIVGGEEGAGHPDIHVVEPESKSRRIVIDAMRDLERELQMRSLLGGDKVAIVVDADRMNAAASNSFLKTLEEPPPGTVVLMLTPRPEAMLETILSRCIEVPLRPAPGREADPREQAVEALVAAAAAEGGVAAAYLGVRRFASLLAEVRAGLEAERDAQLKRDEQKYRQTTDGRSWLDDREEHLKAAGEAHYLAERGRLVGAIVRWWAEVARAAAGAEPGPGPSGRAEAARALAARLGGAEVMRRLQAAEGLAEDFGRTGVNEALSIEVAFLGMCGARGARAG
jgi:DNA polymerase-3 subunit delta'